MIRSGFHLPYNPDLVERARLLRQNLTPAEKKLWYDFLRTFRYRVLRQRPIDNYIVDFYCAQLKLVIEVDGDSHFTPDGKAYDEARTKVMEGYGLRVVRFTNDEVLGNFDAVCQAIATIPSPPLAKGGKIPAAPRTKGDERATPPLDQWSEILAAHLTNVDECKLPPLIRGARGDSTDKSRNE